MKNKLLKRYKPKEKFALKQTDKITFYIIFKGTVSDRGYDGSGLCTY